MAILYSANSILHLAFIISFVYYPSKEHTLLHLNKQVILALQQLREGNVTSFADDIADCYRYNLVRMKKHMVEKYKFHNVANIRVPEKY